MSPGRIYIYYDLFLACTWEMIRLVQIWQIMILRPIQVWHLWWYYFRFKPGIHNDVISSLNLVYNILFFIWVFHWEVTFDGYGIGSSLVFTVWKNPQLWFWELDSYNIYCYYFLIASTGVMGRAWDHLLLFACSRLMGHGYAKNSYVSLILLFRLFTFSIWRIVLGLTFPLITSLCHI